MKWLIKLFKKETSKNNVEKTGKIKFFNRKKGYGFIESENTSKDVFVHATDLEDYVKKGDPVTFELQYGNKGLQAVQVRLMRDKTFN